MEDLNHPLILCTHENGYSISSVLVEFDDNYNMKIHPSLHKNIENVWQTKLQSCSNLFNASKFRLHHCELIEGTNSSLLKLSVGITCYKDFIGTNRAPYAKELFQDGLRDYNDSQAYMADPIGVGGLLISADDNVIFIRRSENCAEMPLQVDRPGGHPEPDVIKSETCQELIKVDTHKITEEIFNSVLKEIRDEINIPLKFLSDPILLGIGYNPNSWRRPSLEFFVRCSLKTSEIQKLYLEQTQAESEESTELLAIPLKFIIKENDIKFYNELTHPAQCAIFFLKVFMSK